MLLSENPRIQAARIARKALRILKEARALGARTAQVASYPTGEAARIADYLRTGQGTIGRKCRTHSRGTKRAVKAGTAARCRDDGRDSDMALNRKVANETAERLDALFQSAGDGGTGFKTPPMTHSDEIAEMFAEANSF